MRLFPVPPRMKGQMKGKRFADVSEVKKKTLEVLNNINAEKSSRNVFRNGENIGTSVSSQKESTLKETKSCNSIKPNKPFKKIIPVIFGSPLVFIRVHIVTK